MSGLRIASIFVLIICWSTAAYASTETAHVALHDPISAIESDYQSGDLSFSEKAVLQIKAIKSPQDLPSQYQILAAETNLSHSRSATLAIRDIMLNWGKLDAGAQGYIAGALTRWTTTYEYVSPSGYFRLHYNTTGTHAVPTADGDASGVPDYVEKCAAYMDTSLSVHSMQGYLLPPSDGTRGGDDKFDVYFESMSYYGYAVPEFTGPQPWNDYGSYLVLHRNFVGFPPNTDPEGDQAGAAKATAAHEFHHCIQFAYDAGEAGWFMELDATHMEDIVYEQVNDNYNYISTYTSNPQISLMDESLHAYASFIWAMYLVEKFDTSMIRAAWEGARYKTIYNAVSDTLQGRYGWSQDSAFTDYTYWNYFTGGRNDGEHYQEGTYYTPATVVKRSHGSYPVTEQSGPVSVQGYAACYMGFYPDGSPGKLRLTFNGDNAASWASYLIREHLDGSYSVQRLTLSTPDWVDTIDVQDFNTYASVIMVAVNLQENSTTGRTFQYSARMQLPYEIATSFVTDSQIYSGTTRIVNVQVKNLSQYYNPIQVLYSDAAGWVVSGASTFTLSPFDSTNVGITVKVPIGTVLDATSLLTYSAESTNDILTKETRQRNEVVVLQRGDLNMSGLIDLNDLSTMIGYLVGLGPGPSPYEAGNFNCAGIVDLADLSTMIAYLTGVGPKSPCAPY